MCFVVVVGLVVVVLLFFCFFVFLFSSYWARKVLSNSGGPVTEGGRTL